MRQLLILSLLTIALPVVAQNVQRPIPENEIIRQRNQEVFERLQRQWLEDLEEAAREQGRLGGGLAPPAVIPQGWVHDYSYDSDLFDYLKGKYQGASTSNKELFVYLYADWIEACHGFRKTVARKEYQALFEDNEIVMLDYAFLKAVYGAEFHKLPVLLRVHENGSVGPESVHPITGKNEHPRKAFYKLKKFLEPEDD